MADLPCKRCGGPNHYHRPTCPNVMLPFLTALQEASEVLTYRASEYQSAANRFQVDIGQGPPTAETHKELWAAFHKLWTRDASSSGLPVNLMTGNGYNKQDWLALERLIEAAIGPWVQPIKEAT